MSNSEIPELFILRRGLKALFHHQDVDNVMDSLAHQTKPLYKEDLYTQLTSLLRICPEGCTIDQNVAVAKEFIQNIGNHGVFDALFSFVSACCIHNGDSVVCRHESMLRWHEMSSLLSEDFLVCAYLASQNITPSTYAWPTYIPNNRESLNDLLSKNLADVHAHLVGSSLNFDVNWLCLMNHVEDMGELFTDIQNGLQNCLMAREYRNQRRNFYLLSILTAAIRLELFGRIIGVQPNATQLLVGALKTYNPLEAQTLATAIIGDVKSYAKDAHEYKSYDHSAIYDYAHCGKYSPPASEVCAYSALTGERLIMYRTLNDIKNNEISEWHTSLFYIYLLVKHKIRHELIQSNDEVGFKNFQHYDQRKVLFLKGNTSYSSQYMGLLNHLSVASMFVKHPEMRLLETRTKPQNNVSKQIKKVDEQINASMLKNSSDYWQYGYIFHYIKSLDNTPADMLELSVRHEALRKRLKKEANSIIKARQEEIHRLELDNSQIHKILGIDAASSEIACRPEVFAQTFRYCRKCIPDIGLTYHVGEDFYDIVDGLRAIDECICYLDIQSFDRLGHTLALGVDVPQYYSKRRNVIAMPKQVALDNLMWLYITVKRCFAKRKVLNIIKDQFYKLYSEIYANINLKPSIKTYYRSWLLRGDNPDLYHVDGFHDTQDDLDIQWHSVRMLNTDEANEARSYLDAQILYYYYHHDAMAKKIGDEVTTLHYTPVLIQVIKSIQKRMLKKVESMHLQIECNPTSNFRIGDIDRYDEHPIQKFYSKGLNYMQRQHRISSSINTDDKGVFATSIEREYSLIAESLIRKYGGSSQAETIVIKWLDEIRDFSVNQSFLK